MDKIKFTRKELEQLEREYITIDETLTFGKDAFVNYPRILETKPIHVTGKGSALPGADLYEFEMHLKGIIVCPCSLTNEPVDVDIDCEYMDCFSFEESESDDVIVLEHDYLDLLPFIYERILLEIPINVVKKGKIKYPSGDGWRILSEKGYEQSKNQEVDPRLAKLKEFKFEE